MYIRIGRRIVNAAQITDVEELPPEEAKEGALVVTFVGGGSLTLRGEDAEKFLVTLPVYSPVLGEE